MIKLKSLLGEIESNIHSDIDNQIVRLEQEWDRLDSMGSNRMKQSEIEQELIRLRAEREKKMGIDPNSQKSKDLWNKVKQSTI